MAHEPIDEKAVFNHARCLASSEERLAYLQQACGDDADARRRILDLLRVYDQEKSFLESPALAPDATMDEQVTEKPGTLIGPYKLLEQIGEGGFGVVFMAEQTEPVRRKVALKVLKAGMDTRQVVARFEAERQALAIMDHPNIAKVHDGGATPSGRPYFVMELVKGVPLTEFCDQNHFTPRQRLELFIPVCQAVQHAHQKGIIHRDLKPSNILVVLHDTTPVPKVIDFGIAKALGQELTDKTLFTGFAQMVGTPLYMSPEQAGQSGLDIDTRSDIYSLGVLLYELLTGTTPFDPARFKKAAYDEIRRIIREEEPPRPSTRLSDSKDSLPSISARRQTEPDKLTKLVRGELDWIVMKALEKDRNRRYETANGLAMDVQRYLADEPVLACPPSVSYRLRKFVRRNKAALFVASSVLVAIFVALAAGLVLMRRENQWSNQALKQATDAERTQRELLAKSYLGEARARRTSGRIGQRFESLKKLKEAARIARELNLPSEFFQELRNEAIACLVLPDVEAVREWDGVLAITEVVEFDPKFEHYAHSDLQGNVSIRRVRDNVETARLKESGPGVHPRFSPDGRFLAVQRQTNARPGGVQVWQPGGAVPALVLEEPQAHGWPADFSPDSRRFAVGCSDHAIAVYELPSGKAEAAHNERARLVRRLQGHPTGGGWLSFHPDGRLLAVVAKGSKSVRIVDSETGTTRDLPQSNAVASAWHPGGRVLGVAGADRKIYLWDIEDRRLRSVLEGHRNHGVTVAFNHAGDLLASNDWDNVLRLWDPQTGRQLFNTPAGWTMALRFSRDDQWLGPDVRGNKVRVLRVADGREFRGLPAPSYGNSSLANPVISPDGQFIVAAADVGRGTSGGLTFIDAHTRDELAFCGASGAFPLMFEPSGALLTTGSAGVLRWPLEDIPGKPGDRRFGPPTQIGPPVKAIGHDPTGASRDGRVIAVPQLNKGTLLIHRGPKERSLILAPQADVRYSAVSPDGRWVATGSHHARANAVKIWDSHTGKPEKDLPIYEMSATWFSPDGRWLATTGGRVRLWHVDSWEEGPPIARAHAGWLAFSADSSLLAMDDEFGAVRLVEPETGRDVARLEAPVQARLRPNCFSRDGSRLICDADEVNAMFVWDLRAIREQLAEMDLDWDTKSLPPAAERKPPQRVEIDLTDQNLFEQGRSYYQARQYAEAIRFLTQALTRNPSDGEAWSTRGEARASLGQWSEAIADQTRGVELRRHDPNAWYRLGLLRLACGDREGHRKLCTEMFQHFGQKDDDNSLHLLTWTCLLAPEAVIDSQHLLKLAAVLPTRHANPGNLNSLGAALYRAGRFQEATENLSRARKTVDDGEGRYWHWLFLAMAYHRQGQTDEAKLWLTKAQEWGNVANKIWWWDRLRYALLYREAEARIKHAPATSTSAAVPTLLTPRAGAVLVNGSPDNKAYAWEFAWSEVKGAIKYHLHVIGGPFADIPAIDDAEVAATVRSVQRSGPVSEPHRRGWRWKVRALMPDGWTAWSEERTFDVAPLRAAGNGAPPPKKEK